MANNLIGRGQVSIVVQKDAYTITQSVGQYIFSANEQGIIPRDITLTSLITVMRGNESITDFSIGPISVPVGFASVTANNSTRTITYKISASTATLADDGVVLIPVLLGGQSYELSFAWAKSRQGVPGAEGSLLDWVADWDTGKTQINGGSVITPKIFAGVKHADGTLTGSAIGHFNLTAVNDQGTVITETIEGIYGFRAGKKTFALDSTGSVVLGRGDQSVTYDALTGKIVFGAGVSLTWSSAIAAAKDAAISSATSIAQGKADAALGAAQSYADAKKSEALAAAASTAQSKADAALGSAKSYADIAKDDAISAAASTAQSKADAALGSAKSYADTKKAEAITDAGKAADSKIEAWTATLNDSIAEAQKAGADARAVADAITTKAANEGWSSKLTYIDGSGIFTGTLSANTVNAVRINASQITAGTISTDRLDAATIRTNIINANYINGLNCAFVQGKIGGWTIGADHISQGPLGALGSSSIQIRSSSAGSGYWCSGSYRPYGISMIWYQNGNAGHIVFGQAAASGNSVKTNFSGLQMMSWDGLEYFCLAANTQLSGAKEVYNRIAGWAFDHQRIWKNNVSLGADGSISSGTKWRLGNDGSGQLASGNISWDAAGNVTFSDSVALQWTNAANFGRIYARGTGLNHSASALVYCKSKLHRED